MGRKRTRKVQVQSEDSDSDFEDTIVIERNQKYGLRPRRSLPVFTEDLVDEDEADLQSDFEDEMKITKTVCYTSSKKQKTKPEPKLEYEEPSVAEIDSVDYDELITPGIVVNEKDIDYEKIIEKSEIQIVRRNWSESPPSPMEQPKRRRGRKPKSQVEKEEAEPNGFSHFLDTEDKIAEDIPLLATGGSLERSEETELNTQETQAEVTENLISANGEMNEQITENCTTLPPNDVMIHTDPAYKLVEEAVDDVEVVDAQVADVDPIKTEAPTQSTSQDNDNVIEINDDDSNDSQQKTAADSYKCLIQSMDDKSMFVDCDESVAILKEKCPKAKFHYLIVPKENIRSLAEVMEHHIPLIEHMMETSKKVVAYPQHKDCTFKIGFNSQPTMFIYNQKFLWLHLHVVSDDMDSEDLLLKKHWNAIHSKLFIKPEDVLEELKTHGHMTSLPTLEECRNILNGDIKCHKCDFTTPKFSAIKKHIANEHKA